MNRATVVINSAAIVLSLSLSLSVFFLFVCGKEIEKLEFRQLAGYVLCITFPGEVQVIALKSVICLFFSL